MRQHDSTFQAMGSHVRVLLGEPEPGSKPADEAADSARRFIGEFEHTLSRFRPDSELCRLNDDPRETVPASELLRRAVGAGVWAAQRTGGLVDPTLVREIEAAGYERSRTDVPPAPLADALAEAPPRTPARAHPDRLWRLIEVDDRNGTVTRPPGVRFDTGGTGKGLAADMLAERLDGYSRFVVDCGGDIRIGGTNAEAWPCEVHVEHPLTGNHAHVLVLGAGGVATSGLNVRIWRGPDGRFAHHLLDPSTGEPAWTGLVGVTALAGTALEAETLSKAALLSAPDAGRDVLGERGGLLIHETKRVELVGPLSYQARIPVFSGRPEWLQEAA